MVSGALERVEVGELGVPEGEGAKVDGCPLIVLKEQEGRDIVAPGRGQWCPLNTGELYKYWNDSQNPRSASYKLENLKFKLPQYKPIGQSLLKNNSANQ